MGPLRSYVLNEPRLIHELLVTKHKFFRRPPLMMRPLAKIDGQGLVLSEGELWRRQRRLVQPAFSTRRFDRYADITVDYTRRMLARWAQGGELNIADEMTRLTLEIIAMTLFGSELAGQTTQLGAAVRIFSEQYVREAGNPFHWPDWMPLPAQRAKRQAIAMLDQMIRGIIRQRRATGEDRGDLLSMLLLAVDEEGDGRGMSDQQARDEAMTLFNAGHDSTAAALAWTWYLVARHPEVQVRLAAEADAVLAGRPATYADVAELSYTQMVVKESLRLYPPTWSLLPREATTSVEIGDYTIPPKAWVYVFPWVTQRDPRFFENPLQFDPERFSPQRVERIPKDAYLPFGGGPRVCIGAAFATMEMVLIVASVLAQFRLRLAAGQPDAEPEALIAIRPRGGVRLSIERRAAPALTDKT
jgi:cytochrome P450